MRRKAVTSTKRKASMKISAKLSVPSSSTPAQTGHGTLLKGSDLKFTISAMFPTEHSARCLTELLLARALRSKLRTQIVLRKLKSHLWVVQLSLAPATKSSKHGSLNLYKELWQCAASSKAHSNVTPEATGKE